MKHVFTAMGTVVSLTAPGPISTATVTQVQHIFTAYERRFSRWIPTAEGAQIYRGELPLAQASAEFRQAYQQAQHWQRVTHGAFRPTTPEGRIDLNGIVKALAIEAAAATLGDGDWCLNAGGDILTSGQAAASKPWLIGIVDPENRQELITDFATGPGRRAVATSGTTERGRHIWTSSDQPFTQVTVGAADIVTADVLATAILAGGPETLTRVTAEFDLDYLALGAASYASAAFLAD